MNTDTFSRNKRDNLLNEIPRVNVPFDDGLGAMRGLVNAALIYLIIGVLALGLFGLHHWMVNR
jgi:hypothetical protein